MFADVRSDARESRRETKPVVRSAALHPRTAGDLGHLILFKCRTTSCHSCLSFSRGIPSPCLMMSLSLFFISVGLITPTALILTSERLFFYLISNAEDAHIILLISKLITALANIWDSFPLMVVSIKAPSNISDIFYVFADSSCVVISCCLCKSNDFTKH